ncbi:MAG: hypothetical protein JSS30_02910 [Verrucomicrobia bacterium]|nr:hypothetical protein [Verrucomicrobiota bacterium]
MLSEIKQVASEKFCHYVGQATCSTLSNFVPSNLPSALTAIAGLGAAAVIIYRNWNATVLTKPLEKEVREDFPELTAEKLEITKFYYVQGLVPIIGSNPGWVNCEAPYLNSDLRRADDSKIPLIEGDYIIRLELNNSNSREDELIKRYYFFPAALVRRLHPKMPIIIKYKGEQKILTISEALFQVLEKTLSRFEKVYYPPEGSLANDPVSVSAKDISSFYVGKRYFAPPKFA